jgi:hypothetical protein
MSSSTSCGVRCISGFCAFNFILWGVAQTLAIWNYDLVASWKLQEPRSMVDETVVATNQAIAMADTAIMLPLFAMSIVGLHQRKFYGVVCAWMVFGITLYWPVVWWMSRITYKSAGIASVPLRGQDLLVTGAIFLFGTWGSWFLYRQRDLLDWWKEDFASDTGRRGEESALLAASGSR